MDYYAHYFAEVVQHEVFSPEKDVTTTTYWQYCPVPMVIPNTTVLTCEVDCHDHFTEVVQLEVYSPERDCYDHHFVEVARHEDQFAEVDNHLQKAAHVPRLQLQEIVD